MSSDAPGWWVDERGSEVLGCNECRRLLALAAKRHLHGHVAVGSAGAPELVPVDFTVSGIDVILQVGEGLFSHLVDRPATFEVDNGEVVAEWAEAADGQWSVVARGYASEVSQLGASVLPPEVRVPSPGRRLVRVRCDSLTGRRLAADRPLGVEDVR
jgi:hypothetical protein